MGPNEFCDKNVGLLLVSIYLEVLCLFQSKLVVVKMDSRSLCKKVSGVGADV